MKSTRFFLLTLAVAAILFAVPALAQTTDDIIMGGGDTLTDEPVLVSAQNTSSVDGEAQDADHVSATDVSEQDVVLETMEGVEISEPTKIPSNWSLLWKGIRERVSIATTLNPVKKAEKRLQYATERMRMAEYIAENTTDPKVQEKVEKVVKRANKLMEKVEANKEKWMEKPGVKAQVLLKNIASYQVKKDRVWDVLEAKLPEEKVEKLKDLQQQAIVNGQGLLKAIGNENLPPEVKEHLQNVKQKIEEHAADVKMFQEKKQELLQAAKQGDEQAKEQVKELWQERKQELQENREAFQEKKQALIEAVKTEVPAMKGKLEMKVLEKAKEMLKEKQKPKAADSSTNTSASGGAGATINTNQQEVGVQSSVGGSLKTENVNAVAPKPALKTKAIQAIKEKIGNQQQ